MLRENRHDTLNKTKGGHLPIKRKLAASKVKSKDNQLNETSNSRIASNEGVDTGHFSGEINQINHYSAGSILKQGYDSPNTSSVYCHQSVFRPRDDFAMNVDDEIRDANSAKNSMLNIHVN